MEELRREAIKLGLPLEPLNSYIELVGEEFDLADMVVGYRYYVDEIYGRELESNAN